LSNLSDRRCGLIAVRPVRLDARQEKDYGRSLSESVGATAELSPPCEGGVRGVVSELPATGLQMKLPTAISGMVVSKPEDTVVPVSVAIKPAFPPL
jgi:hypothetical protein